MEEQLKALLEKAKTNQKLLRELMEVSVNAGERFLADELKRMENEYFPVDEKHAKARERAQLLSLVFRMVDLGIPEGKCYLIERTLKRFWKRGGNFTLSDAAELQRDTEKIFG